MRVTTSLLGVVGVGFLIEILTLAWLFSLEPGQFRAFTRTPDTPSYLAPALPLAEAASLIPSSRTPGYPIFLAAGYLIGGRRVAARQSVIHHVWHRRLHR